MKIEHHPVITALGCSKIFFSPKVLLLFQTDNVEALVKEPVLFSTLFFN